MGLPVTERGGPPGGGGIGRPDALVGAWVGAEGGDAGGPPAWGTAGGRGAAGAEGAGVAGRAGATGRAGAGAAAGAAAAGATGVGGWGGAGAAGAAAGAGATGAGVTGVGMRGGALVAGCSEAGRLVIRRAPERLTGAVDGGAGLTSGPLPSGTVTPPSELGVRSGAGVSTRAGAVATALAAAFLVAAAFLAGGAGSSGCTGRRRPSRSAFRRARSACASSMDDEWLLTPIPRDKQRSSASLLVRPSS